MFYGSVSRYVEIRTPAMYTLTNQAWIKYSASLSADWFVSPFIYQDIRYIADCLILSASADTATWAFWPIGCWMVVADESEPLNI